MDFLMQLWRGLVEVWRRLDTSGRVTIIASGLLATVAVAGLSMWSAQPEYRMLLTNLASEDADAIVADLQTRGISYRFSDGGTTISVPSDQVYSLRNQISQAGTAPSGQVRGWEIFDRTTLGMTEFLQNINAQRARAGALARTIEAYSVVRRAIVNLSIPEERMLATQEAKPSAAIVLQLTHPGALDPLQIRGIRNVVAASVPRLSPDRVTVVDTDGTMLARPIEAKDSPIGVSSQQLEAKVAYENYLQERVKTVLTPLFANFSVAVSASMSFDQREINTIEYTPDGRVARSEQTTTETVETEDTSAIAAPGPTANLPGEFQSPTGELPMKTISNTEDIITNYEVSRTDTRTVEAPGAVTKIMVAAVVEPVLEDAEGNRTFRPLTDDENTSIPQMIMNAVGADQTRGDEVTLMAASFAVAAVQIAPPAGGGMAMRRVLEVIQRHVLPIALMAIALLVIRATLRRGLAAAPAREPIPVPEEDVSAEVAMRRRVQEEVEQLSAEQPQVLATLLKTWLSAD